MELLRGRARHFALDDIQARRTSKLARRERFRVANPQRKLCGHVFLIDHVTLFRGLNIVDLAILLAMFLKSALQLVKEENMVRFFIFYLF